MAPDLRLMYVLLLLSAMYCSGSLDANGKSMDEPSNKGQLRLRLRKVLEKKATTVTNSGEVRPSELGNNTPLSRYTYPITTPTPPTIITTPPAVTTPTPIITPPTTPTTTPVLNPPTAPVTTTPTTPTTTTPAVSGSWCVARTNVPENSLQVALDYACGLGGADCRAVLQGGQCYQPITVAGHASYAFNSYYQKNNKAPGTCDFGGNAIITTTNPSYGSCTYASGSSTISTPPPATISTAPPPPAMVGIGTAPPPPSFSTTPTPPTTPTTTTPAYNVSSPTGGITNPTGGITTPTVGGITGGLGPSASTYNTTPPYGSAPSFFQDLPSSFILFLLSLVVAVILG